MTQVNPLHAATAASRPRTVSRSSKRTKTIGLRLTPVEIAALDEFIATQEPQGLSRAGAAANLVIDGLAEAGLLVEDGG